MKADTLTDAYTCMQRNRFKDRKTIIHVFFFVCRGGQNIFCSSAFGQISLYQLVYSLLHFCNMKTNKMLKTVS